MKVFIFSIKEHEKQSKEKLLLSINRNNFHTVSRLKVRKVVGKQRDERKTKE